MRFTLKSISSPQQSLPDKKASQPGGRCATRRQVAPKSSLVLLIQPLMASNFFLCQLHQHLTSVIKDLPVILPTWELQVVDFRFPHINSQNNDAKTVSDHQLGHKAAFCFLFSNQMVRAESELNNASASPACRSLFITCHGIESRCHARCFV